MPTQIPNTCVTSIMEYINHTLCGGNVNEGVYIQGYYASYGGNVLTDGVVTTNITSFVNNYFSTATFTGYANAINSGSIVMTNIASSIPNSSHNVAVVGYHPDGSLIYMDPELGSLQQAPASNFGSLYSIRISGCNVE
jgi:hypothetical protein